MAHRVKRRAVPQVRRILPPDAGFSDPLGCYSVP